MNVVKKYMIILPVIGILFSACEEVIDVEIGDEHNDLYAVEAKITTAGPPTVFLTKGISITVDEASTGISDAFVSISDDSQPVNKVVLTEDPDSAGYYVVPESDNYIGVAGREYTLEIIIGDLTLMATDYLAPVEPIDSIQVRPSSFGDNEFLAISIFSQETPGTGNFYKWDIYVNNTLIFNSEDMAFASDEFVDGNYVDDAEIFLDYYNSAHGMERRLNYLDTVLVHQNSISGFAYDFYYQMQQQSYGGGPFSVPPANVNSNIISSDGKDVLGMFTAQDVSFSNVVIIDDSIEGQLKK